MLKVIYMRKFYIILAVFICCFLLAGETALAGDVFYDENGNLLYYYAEYEGNTKMTIPAVDKTEAVETARNFILQHAPSVMEKINTEVYTINYNKEIPYGYIITFPEVINNIPYNNDTVTVFVDSKVGKVTTYSANLDNYAYIEGEDKIISVADAQNKYRDALGIKLQYNKKIVDNKIVPYLAYICEDMLINANTGNIIPTAYYIPDDGYFDVVNTAEKVSEYIDNEDVISISDAISRASAIKELGITSDYSVTSVDYLKNYDGTYLISLLYKRGINTKEVTLNAKSGLLVEYNDYSSDTLHYKTESAEEFLNTYYGEYVNKVIKRKSIGDEYSVFLYERLVNDIPYKSNGIYASFRNGKLVKLSLAWDNVDFPSADRVISIEYAYQQFFNKTGFDLTYHKRDNGALVPVYKMTSRGTGIFDAINGRQLNYDGSIFYSAKELDYLDMNEHYSGYAAKELSECDIYVSSGNVFLEDNISQQEYMLLISEFIKGTKPILNTTGILTDEQREMLYAYMYEHNILERAETDYTAYITRADAVKYFLRILGYGEIGDMSDIFINHFADWEDIPRDAIGYVELARSLKIINGTTNNMFKPNEYITNGDSLIIIHNYLTNQE